MYSYMKCEQHYFIQFSIISRTMKANRGAREVRRDGESGKKPARKGETEEEKNEIEGKTEEEDGKEGRGEEEQKRNGLPNDNEQ